MKGDYEFEFDRKIEPEGRVVSLTDLCRASAPPTDPRIAILWRVLHETDVAGKILKKEEES